MRAIACGHLAKARAQPFAAPHDGYCLYCHVLANSATCTAAHTQQPWRGRSVVVPPATDGCDMAAHAVCCVAHAATLWIASMRRMRSPVTVSTSFHIYWKKSRKWNCFHVPLFSALPCAIARDGVLLELTRHTVPQIQNSGSCRPLSRAQTLHPTRN